MIVKRRVRAALGGTDAAVGDQQVLDPPHALVCVNDAVLGAGAHARAADQMRVALDREDVLRAGGLQDPLEDLLRVLHVALVVLAARVGEVRDRHPVSVLLLGERHAVLGLRQQLVEHTDRRPVVVVAHVLAQRPAEVPLGDHVLGPADR